MGRDGTGTMSYTCISCCSLRGNSLMHNSMSPGAVPNRRVPRASATATIRIAIGFLGATIGALKTSLANDELLVMQNNPSLWVMPNGHYSSTRYSTLSQINKDNV